MAIYNPLEGSFTQTLTGDQTLSTFNTSSLVSFGSVINSLWIISLSFIAVLIFWYGLEAAMLKTVGGQKNFNESNNIFERLGKALFYAFAIYITIITINPGMVRTDNLFQGFSGLGGRSGGAGATGTFDTQTGSGASTSCDSKENVLASLSSSAGLCGSLRCSILSNCNYQPYLSTIKQEANRQGIDYRLVVVTMCKESNANPNAQPHDNGNGTFDCGIMQINQNGGCNSSILVPEKNIELGVGILKNAIASAGEVIQGIPQNANAFAIYNAGQGYSSQSADCTPQNGFPSKFPKWACPINPGDNKSNMCSVKNYACELNNCVGLVP